MDSSLAKELKDAGFPQEKKKGHILELQMWNSTEGFGMVYVPTLEELIEACGGDFGTLTFADHKEYKTGIPSWYAYERNDMRNFNEAGRTPAEAVARLWLALNKNT